MYGSQFKNDSAVLGGRLVRRGVGRARSPTRHTPNTGLLHALLLFNTHTLQTPRAARIWMCGLSDPHKSCPRLRFRSQAREPLSHGRRRG